MGRMDLGCYEVFGNYGHTIVTKGAKVVEPVSSDLIMKDPALRPENAV